MNRDQFIDNNRADWKELQSITRDLNKLRSTASDDELVQFPSRYRKACRDLSIARHRKYGLAVTERLNRLVQQGSHLLYRTAGPSPNPLHFLLVRLPSLVRQNQRLLWLSTLLFFGPFTALLLSYKFNPDWIYSLMSPGEMEQIDAMYARESDSLESIRNEFGSDFRMFAFYVFNNIGIDFRIFAGGILAGLGTIFFLLFNGCKIGATFGYVHMEGNPELLWNFCCSHSAFELIGMLLAGMAGLRLGLAIIKPGESSRAASLKENLSDTIHLLYGATFLTFLAAIVEGFWSASPIVPNIARYVFSALTWIGVILLFTFSGRHHER